MMRNYNNSSTEEYRSPRVLTALPAVVFHDQLKVAAYCRVSTDLQDQDESFEMQKIHYEGFIRDHPGWQPVGIYQERISATHLDKRVEMNRLLDDCRLGRIDLVVTRSISRFARNTTDLLWMVRKLSSLGVGILFEKENIDTRSKDGEFMLSLLASCAEQESHSTSENNKWAIRKRFEEGSYRYSSAPYGYDLADGTFVINEREAEVVRSIFTSFLSGKGIRVIADDLNRRGIPPKRVNDNWTRAAHSGVWSPSVISGILKNEAYLGDSLLQKNYHDERFLIRANKGELPRYYLEDHHEGIVDPDIFKKAGRLLEQRRKEYRSGSRKKRYTFSGVCVCARCGHTLIRDLNRRTQKKTVFWVCLKHRRNASDCDLPPVVEEDICHAFVTMMNKLHYADVIVDIFCQEAEESWRRRHNEEIRILEDRYRKNQEERNLLTLTPGRTVYYIDRKSRLEREAQAIETELKALGRPDKEKIRLLKRHIQTPMGSTFSEDIFRDVIEQVRVEDRRKFTFVFRCGMVLTE